MGGVSLWPFGRVPELQEDKVPQELDPTVLLEVPKVVDMARVGEGGGGGVASAGATT